MIFANEWLWLLMLILNFAAILAAYRFWGRTGMYVWVSLAVIIANIQVVKTVALFGLTSSLGNIVYGTSFLATDILSENYGKKAAGKAVGIGFLSMTALTLFMNLALMFEPAAADFAHESMSQLYALLPRIALASFVAYGVSQVHDIRMYSLLKRRFPKHIWLRNNASTMLSQGIDSLVFVTIAFAGILPVRDFWQIVLSTWVFKWVVAAADTPLIYLAARWKKNGLIKEI